MFIAMNRFQVTKGSEEAFEQVWRSRDSHLDKVPGFVEFHLLKGPEAEDHTLYASHTVWKDRAAFEAWTRSEVPRRACAGRRQQAALSGPSEIRRVRAHQDVRVSMEGKRRPGLDGPRRALECDRRQKNIRAQTIFDTDFGTVLPQ
jgi:heme-degrading monooxygenase HmoA